MAYISEQNPLLLLGCGKMGLAMLSGWLKAGIAANHIHIIETNDQIRDELQSLNVHLYEHMDAFKEQLIDPAILLLAVKPQTLDLIKAELKGLVGKMSIILSIVAGKNIHWMQSVFGDQQAIIRSMPNTPAQISQSITGLYANIKASSAQKEIANMLLSAIGETVWVEDEDQMDALTALSGSGPAWVFLLTEAMSHAACKQGLSEHLSQKLARKTVEGAAALMAHDAHISPADLRLNVTSPKGTTAEAMDILMGADGWQKVIDRAMEASTQRSRILSKT